MGAQRNGLPRSRKAVTIEPGGEPAPRPSAHPGHDAHAEERESCPAHSRVETFARSKPLSIRVCFSRRYEKRRKDLALAVLAPRRAPSGESVVRGLRNPKESRFPPRSARRGPRRDRPPVAGGEEPKPLGATEIRGSPQRARADARGWNEIEGGGETVNRADTRRAKAFPEGAGHRAARGSRAAGARRG